MSDEIKYPFEPLDPSILDWDIYLPGMDEFEDEEQESLEEFSQEIKEIKRILATRSKNKNIIL